MQDYIQSNFIVQQLYVHIPTPFKTCTETFPLAAPWKGIVVYSVGLSMETQDKRTKEYGLCAVKSDLTLKVNQV